MIEVSRCRASTQPSPSRSLLPVTVNGQALLSPLSLFATSRNVDHLFLSIPPARFLLSAPSFKRCPIRSIILFWGSHPFSLPRCIAFVLSLYLSRIRTPLRLSVILSLPYNIPGSVTFDCGNRDLNRHRKQSSSHLPRAADGSLSLSRYLCIGLSLRFCHLLSSFYSLAL